MIESIVLDRFHWITGALLRVLLGDLFELYYTTSHCGLIVAHLSPEMIMGLSNTSLKHVGSAPPPTPEEDEWTSTNHNSREAPLPKILTK